MHILINATDYPTHEGILRRHIAQRIDADFAPGGMTVTLAVDPAVGPEESYRVDGAGNDWRIIGADERGLCYGMGYFLHNADWTERDFAPRPTSGVVSPDCPFRCIYFAVHFYNWYHMAPLEELELYLEDMMLYGYNALECIIPVVNMYSFEDEVYGVAVEKSRALFTTAKRVGMKTMLCVCPNQGLQSAPHDWDADLSYEKNSTPPFVRPQYYRGVAGRNLCPNKPGALEYLRGIWVRFMEQYLDIGLDYVSAWPYDEGGCGCEKCAPWGANGFEKLTRVLAQDAQRLYPGSRFIYATWTFDVPDDQKEYSTLYRRMADGEMDYVDYLMTDSHTSYPRYVLEHPVIKPIVNFPEISMWGLFPWGGFGASPLPKRFEELWDSSRAVLSGGMPYSEGLYEDISKIQCVGYYWDKNARYADTLRRYAEYEFGAGTGEDAVRLMELIEKNHVSVQTMQERCLADPAYGASYRGEPVPDLAAAQEALALAKKIDARLSEKRRKAWRWRILYIRAVLDEKRYAAFYDKNMTLCYDDLHTVRHDSKDLQILCDDDEAQELYRELRRIYHTLDHDNGSNKWTLPVVYGET